MIYQNAAPNVTLASKSANTHFFCVLRSWLAHIMVFKCNTRSVDTQSFYSNRQGFIIWTGKTTQELSTLPLFNCRIYSYSFGPKGFLSPQLDTMASANWRKSAQNPEPDSQQNMVLVSPIHAVYSLKYAS